MQMVDANGRRKMAKTKAVRNWSTILIFVQWVMYLISGLESWWMPESWKNINQKSQTIISAMIGPEFLS